MYFIFKTTVHRICKALWWQRNGKWCIQTDSNNKGNALIVNPLVRVCEQGSLVQALLILAHIISEDEVAGFVSTFATGYIISSV